MTDTDDNDFPLPELREDLQLLEGPPAFDGSPTWTIFDPIRNSYFKVGWMAFQLLSRWSTGMSRNLLETVRNETTCIIDENDIKELIKFLYGNSLTRDSAHNSSDDYYVQYLASKPNWFIWLLKNYLFLRIPLVRPNVFLQKIVPYLDPLFSSVTRHFVIFIGLLGLYLASRQWDTFINTLLYFYSFKGVVFYVIALVFIKVLHELGHAMTATRFGCKIPTMGVAFLVLFPVMYTDTTDAYRLASRRQRLYIGAAGMLTELYLAMICIFFWSFLPDGILRSTVFVVGTISIFLTFLINLNPFMRFDGYYILSDWLGIQNLQGRSFALGKWKLREILFSLNDPPPEKYSANMLRFLIIYAWSTWIYRFFLLLAIALVVYYLFFKLLGIILLIAELFFFIAMPITKEIIVWWSKREPILRSKRSYLTGGMLLIILFLFVIPWNSRVSFPAIMEPEEKTIIFAPAPGRIEDVYVKNGDDIHTGDVIIVLSSPIITNEILLTQKRIEAINLRMQRIAANVEDLVDVHILFQQLKEQESNLSGLLELQDRLVIRSPISGKIVDLADSLHKGRWINEQLQIAYIVKPSKSIIEGMVYENDLSRLIKTRVGLFIPDDAVRESFDVRVSEIEQANITSLDILYLASVFGGDIAVRQDEDDHLVPETSVYRVKLKLIDEQRKLPNQVIRGIIHVKAEPKSFANRLYEIIVAVLIRGSGF